MRPYVPKNIRQLRRLLKDMPVGMLTTQTGGGSTHSRPMTVHEIDDDGWLWFLTDRHSRKAWELVLVAVRVTRAEYWLVPRWPISRFIDATTAMVSGRRGESGRHGILDLHPAPL
jgi:hypothetical protein